MQIDKDTVLQLLRQVGDHDKAQAADAELPGQVDTERDAGLLGRLGIDPGDLVRMLTSGGAGGGIGGALGGLMGGGQGDQGGEGRDDDKGGGIGGALGGLLGR